MLAEQNSKRGPESRLPRILVVGLGNDLLMDDGIGVHAVRKMKERRLGPRVMALEVGTAVLEALHLFERADCILAVDAMQAGGEPGTVYRLTGEDVARRERVSMHDFTFHSALTLLRKQPKQIMFIGVEPDEIAFGMEPTAKVAQAIGTVLRGAEETIESWQQA